MFFRAIVHAVDPLVSVSRRHHWSGQAASVRLNVKRVSLDLLLDFSRILLDHRKNITWNSILQRCYTENRWSVKS
jgi:hypothetical protein